MEIRLKLQGRDITVHWQRDRHAGAPLKADRVVGWGDWVELDALPMQAVLLVHGEAVLTQPPDVAVTGRSP